MMDRTGYALIAQGMDESRRDLEADMEELCPGWRVDREKRERQAAERRAVFIAFLGKED